MKQKFEKTSTESGRQILSMLTRLAVRLQFHKLIRLFVGANECSIFCIKPQRPNLIHHIQLKKLQQQHFVWKVLHTKIDESTGRLLEVAYSSDRVSLSSRLDVRVHLCHKKSESTRARSSSSPPILFLRVISLLISSDGFIVKTKI